VEEKEAQNGRESEGRKNKPKRQREKVKILSQRFKRIQKNLFFAKRFKRSFNWLFQKQKIFLAKFLESYAKSEKKTILLNQADEKNTKNISLTFPQVLIKNNRG